MGWYHSHPFDVGMHSHCFLSQTDLSTQLQWQRAEDPHGNPFVAVVVDPLRSLAKNVPEVKAFRVYPPDYNSPVGNECPDGTVVGKEKTRLEKWGSCWSRYYELEVDYFMSRSSRHVMDILTRNFLWMRNLGTTPSLEAETRKRYPERVSAVVEKIQNLDLPSIGNTSLGGAQSGGGRGGDSGLRATQGAGTATIVSSLGRKDADEGEISKACQGVVELASEKIHANMVQMAKKELFS